MAKMNDLVESQGKEPREVARNYLKEINFYYTSGIVQEFSSPCWEP